jgi:DNA helicase-2/ATP-dependent DNA helicase PcrA
LTGEDDCGLLFTGYIDAVFSNNDGEYLIVDWKTDKNDSKSSEHKQQLEAYRHAFATVNNVPLDKVKTALAFVGLRPAINTGRIEAVLDEKQPGKTALGTFAKRANTIVSWKRDPKQFFTDLFEKDNNEPLWAALKEQYSLESGA